ncbi:MAG: hypothetical protein NTV04_11210, partial [Deltaproteobacteria bacterium]|nr:hypothetical protein [Deltaproteobacteria bacterium]
LPLKAEFPAGASANRAAIPAPNPSVLPKTMVQSEGGKPVPLLDKHTALLYVFIRSKLPGIPFKEKF